MADTTNTNSKQAPENTETRNRIAWRLTLTLGLLAMLPIIAAIINSFGLSRVSEPLSLAHEQAVDFQLEKKKLQGALQALDATLAKNSPLVLSTQRQASNFTSHPFAQLFRQIEPLDYSLLGAELQSAVNTSVMEVGDKLKTLDLMEASYLAAREETEKIYVAVTDARQNAEDLLRRYRYDEGADLSENTFGQLSELGFLLSKVSLATERGFTTIDPAELGAWRTQFESSLRAAIFQLAVLDDEDTQIALADSLGVLFDNGLGPNSLFATASNDLDLLSDLERERTVTGALFGELQENLDTLDTQSSTAASTALTSTRGALDTSLVTALAAGAIGSIVAIVVGWTYVRRRLLVRIRRLSEVAQQLGAGNFSVDLQVSGDDELTELEAAMISARSNAVTLLRHERVLTERQEQLELANRELDKFAYVASHDLRAPLRGIDSLASFLEEDLGTELPEESASHLSLMRARIRRLESLLAGLLEYSRVGKDDQIMESVNLDALIRNSADLVSKGSHPVTVETNLPVVRTLVAPLEQVVRNLVDNATKHHDRETGNIKVTAWLEDITLCLEVADDGPGVEPRYQDRVFEMFQTLKSRDSQEANGMGLAILKKTIETAGGNISLKTPGLNGRGLTMTVRWPVEPFNTTLASVS